MHSPNGGTEQNDNVQFCIEYGAELRHDSSDEPVEDVNYFFVKDDFDSYSLMMWIECKGPEGSSNTMRKPSKTKVLKKSMSKNTKTIIALAVVILCCLPMLSGLLVEPSHTDTEMSFGIGMPIHDLWADGAISVVLNDSDAANITYTLTYLGKVSGDCTWYLRTDDGVIYDIVDSTAQRKSYSEIDTGRIISVSDDILHTGSFDLKLVVGSVTYTDLLILDGEVSISYQWTFIGIGGVSKECSMDVQFNYIEYYEYTINTSIGRSTSVKVADFAVVTPLIDGMVSSLRAEYIEQYGSFDDNWFVNYILTFVQMCYGYPPSSQPDLYLFGEMDYFAYPIQVIFLGMGDCEDTSILAAAMFNSAGYEAAVGFVYSQISNTSSIIGHAVAAVNLTAIVTDINTDLGNYVRYYKTIDETTFFSCETTTDIQLAAGFIEETYLETIASKMNNFYIVTVNNV